MKQKDIALLIVIAAVAAFASFFISNKLFVTPANRQQEVEVVDPISSEFQKPSDKYFNMTSVNPQQAITVGTSNNQNPFSGQ